MDIDPDNGGKFIVLWYHTQAEGGFVGSLLLKRLSIILSPYFALMLARGHYKLYNGILVVADCWTEFIKRLHC